MRDLRQSHNRSRGQERWGSIRRISATRVGDPATPKTEGSGESWVADTSSMAGFSFAVSISCRDGNRSAIIATASHDSVTLTWDDPGDDTITG